MGEVKREKMERSRGRQRENERGKSETNQAVAALPE